MYTVRYDGDVSDAQVRWGGNDDPRGLLIPGATYHVTHEDVHAWHTKLGLQEFPGKQFNSVHFTQICEDAFATGGTALS